MWTDVEFVQFTQATRNHTNWIKIGVKLSRFWVFWIRCWLCLLPFNSCTHGFNPSTSTVAIWVQL